MVHYKENEYGFEYGDMKVERLASDDEKGWVVLGVSSTKSKLQIYVTKTGKIRVHKDGVELT
jgi:hypothetical protein